MLDKFFLMVSEKPLPLSRELLDL